MSMDTRPTVMLNSVAKLNWRPQVGGALTHVKFAPHTVSREAGSRKMYALAAGHCQCGATGGVREADDLIAWFKRDT